METKRNAPVVVTLGVIWTLIISAITTIVVNMIGNGGEIRIEYRASDSSIHVPDVGLVEAESEPDSLVKVDEVDGGKIEESELDFGRGESIDISDWRNFVNALLGKCFDLDGKWGSQCVDDFAYFHYLYTGRWVSTCGQGTARGIWECREINAGDDYKIVYSIDEMVEGGFAFYDGGLYGHVGEVVGKTEDGYTPLFGANQGGASCPGGGSASNIIKKSTGDFLGGLIPKIYLKAPTVPDSGILK